jgi:Holliday junction resolvase-like predicted endonuclease
MPRYAARTDKSHEGIREALRAMGWLVHDTSRLGGFVDLVVSKGGHTVLVEVKTALSKRGTVRKTRRQVDMLEQGWPIVTLCDVDQAIQWAQQPERTR